MDEVRVQVWRLVQDQGGKDVVLLRDEQQRHLPIWIGPYEATAIWLKLAGAQANGMVRRPMTHDLCASIIERFGGKLERVVIDDFSNDTYYAKIYFAIDGPQPAHRREIVVDSRPSDAIALALRCDAPVWVADQVMEAGAVAIAEDESSAPPEAPEEEPGAWPEQGQS